MKKVIEDARKYASIHLTHLLTLNKLIEKLEAEEKYFNYQEDFWDIIISYKKALDQPLTLSQFVPCDSEGKPMEKPEKMQELILMEAEPSTEKLCQEAVNKCFKAYKQAQKAVLFEGFTHNRKRSEFSNGTWSVSITKNGLSMDAGEYNTVDTIEHLTIKDLAEHTESTLKLKQ